MRDILIGIGYFSVTIGFVVYGICLIVKPQKFATFITRPIIRTRSADSSQSWTKEDGSRWRIIGALQAAFGAFMFLAPLITALTSSEGTPDSPSKTSSHQPFHSGNLASTIIWFVFFCIGCSLCLWPASTLRVFGSRQSSDPPLTGVAAAGPWLVGVIVAVVTLWELIRIVNH
jgi:hypothetical protein